VTAVATLPALHFSVLGAERVEHAATPTLRFAVQVDSTAGHPIRSLLLDTQVRIAAQRRRYDAAAQERLFELFGAPGQWGSTLRSLLWTQVTVVVPPFEGSTTVAVPVVCTYDLDVTAARYFAALDDGEVPIELLFSGSVFYAAADGRLQTARISWEQEAEYRLPVRVWRETLDQHFPGSAWLRLGRDHYDRLAAYKARHALASWEATVDALLGD
jgi:Family of unknown function (DUF6084)